MLTLRVRPFGDIADVFPNRFADDGRVGIKPSYNTNAVAEPLVAQ